uniref:Uncharacterized protein n=1 Tax=Acidithiobacillus sulfuriphilus TaxID=1867749 RepID=A0A3M8RFD7_9PROT|nr:hypothetical protein EC580_04600 [Acidithiobacillus sulfuriphilus]
MRSDQTLVALAGFHPPPDELLDERQHFLLSIAQGGFFFANLFAQLQYPLQIAGPLRRLLRSLAKCLGRLPPAEHAPHVPVTERHQLLVDDLQFLILMEQQDAAKDAERNTRRHDTQQQAAPRFLGRGIVPIYLGRAGWNRRVPPYE